MNAFVETPQGSRRRTRYDETTFVPRESFDLEVPYPHAYGFIPGTNRRQEDCVDCYILSNGTLEVGHLENCVILGMFEMWEDQEEDHKVLLGARLTSEVDIEREVQKIQSFLRTVFRKFPDADLRFGALRDPESTLAYIEDRR